MKAGSPEEAQQLDAFRRHVPHTLIQSLERTGEIREAGNSRYIDGVLTRFLRAEKHDVDAAAARLTKHAAWREQHMPKQGIPDVSNGSITPAFLVKIHHLSAMRL